jgi:RimJ/RimL family protein N-acetyltransferase
MMLRTARFLLRPRTLADTEACLAMDQDAAVRHFVDGVWDGSAAHRAFIEARTRGPWPPGMGYWAITREGRGFLGWVELVPHAEGVEIGWRVPAALRGQGIATEAAAALIAAAPPGARLIADIATGNLASLRVAEKLGFTLWRDEPPGGALHARLTPPQAAPTG